MVREQESERVNVSDSGGGGGEKSETGGELHPSRYADSSIAVAAATALYCRAFSSPRTFLAAA